MAEAIDDQFLIERFKRGDEAAFETIIERYSSDVAVLANRLLGWPADVEDVTQDVFLAAFLGLKKFRCECSLKTWLFTIAINKCRTYRYRRMLRLQRFSHAASRASLLPAPSAEKTPTDGDTNDRVRYAVKKLPGKYREPMVLKYLHELPTDQIARILGVSATTLQTRLSRARSLLRERLADIVED